MISIPNLLILAVFSYYINYIIELIINRKERNSIKIKNEKLQELRNIPNKTLEEQKKFLDTKFKKEPFKFSWVWFRKFILKGGQYALIFFINLMIFGYFNLNFKIWHALTFILIFPIIINFILRKFNFQKDDLTVFIK